MGQRSQATAPHISMGREPLWGSDWGSERPTHLWGGGLCGAALAAPIAPHLPAPPRSPAPLRPSHPQAPPPHFRPRPRPFRSRPPMLPAHGAAPQWPRALLLGARRCAVRAALCGAGAALLLWAAAFAYGGFYFLTVPAAGLVAPVHFRFR